MRYNFQVSSVTSNNLLKTNFAFHNLAHHAEIIPILPEFKYRIKLFDTDKLPYVIEEGERAAEAHLPYIRETAQRIRTMTKIPKSVTLVIGSGGIKCAAAIGLWKVLQENDIQLNGVVGCSGGSLYGALIANHSDIKEMEERSYQLWTSDLMQGYITNLKASQDGSLKFNEHSGLVDDSVH
jgi:hypothetical protein